MSDRLPCGLCGGSMSMLRSGTGKVSRDIVVCRHCDMPCKTWKCAACASVGRAKNDL